MNPDTSSGEHRTRQSGEAWYLTDAGPAFARMVVVLGSFVALGMGSILLWYPLDWSRFVLPSIIATLALVIVLGVRLVLVNRAGSPVRLTIPTVVTLGRGALVAVFIGVVLGAGDLRSLSGGVVSLSGQTRWLLGGIFVIAGLLDAVDGTLARRLDAVSELGSRIDAEVDGSLTLIGATTVVLIGSASPLFLLVGLARYLFVAGLLLIRSLGQATTPLHPNRFRAPLSAVVLVAIVLALLPPTPMVLTRWVTLLVAIPFLLNFAWDWRNCANFRPK